MKGTYKGKELPFDLPINAADIPDEYLAILPPLPDEYRWRWLLTIDSETGELIWVVDYYRD